MTIASVSERARRLDARAFVVVSCRPRFRWLEAVVLALSDPPAPLFPRAVLTEDEINAAINAYETRCRIMLSPEQRTSLRILARQQPTGPRRALHPIGHDSDPTEDQHTAPNRAALKSCLRGYWDGTLVREINQRQDTSTGVALGDRMVSLLEIGCALREQKRIHGAMSLLLERRFRDNWTVEQMCQAGNYHKSVYYEQEAAALDDLNDDIFRDNWTEAKSQDQYEEVTE